ncbi:MAG: ubiquinone/menaquinone biosynthesis C-methylase UbiE [Cryomorphaceae bacterium]|jgi:ubiquinone/menaquinone biosynthesis C-methylase UbiE
MRILNLGCGDKTSKSSEVINIDWSIYHSIKCNSLLEFIALPFFDENRKKYYNSLPENIMVHNLKKGIPFENNSIDVVYHSHVFEHIPKQQAEKFQNEVIRVLKPGGIQRIVIPDMEILCSELINHIIRCDDSEDEIKKHDNYIDNIIGQCIQEQSVGTMRQPKLQSVFEKLLLGSAKKRGQTHQWMYDRINLKQLLKKSGFSNIRHLSYNLSDIRNWNSYGLDLNKDKSAYKKRSLYMECTKI